MAKTNAERQREYRKRRSTTGDNGERQANMWVSTHTKLNMQRIAQAYAISERELIENLVEQEWQRLTQALSDSDFDQLIHGQYKIVTE